MAIQQTEDFIPQVDEFSLDSDTLDARPADSGAIKSGWDAAISTVKPAQSDFPETFSVPEKPQVIKILDTDGPCATYALHWLTKEGRRGYACVGNGCPLCVTLKDTPQNKYAFSVAVIENNVVTRKKMIGGVRLFKTLLAADSSPQGPLSKNFWAISKSGTMAATIYSLNAVKARDLNEDWGIDEEAVSKQIAVLKPFTRREIISDVTFEELQQIAKDLA
jgi:hypothetical protein